LQLNKKVGKHEVRPEGGKHARAKSGSSAGTVRSGRHEKKADSPRRQPTAPVRQSAEQNRAPKATEFSGWTEFKPRKTEAFVQAETETAQSSAYVTKWELKKTQQEPQQKPEENFADIEPVYIPPRSERRPKATAAQAAVEEPAKVTKRAAADVRPSTAPRKKKKRGMSLAEKLLIIIPATAAVIAAAAVMLLVDKGGTHTINSDLYQHYAGSKHVISGGIELEKDEDGTTVLTHNSEKQTLSDLPLYYEDRSGIVLPQAMVYYAPREDLRAQIQAFTDVNCDSNGSVIISLADKSQVIPAGFLHNGKDYYLFLEPVTVSFNSYSFDLPALSYVEAVYGSEVIVFNYETEETFIESAQGEVTAKISSGDYTVYMLNDSIERHDGMKTLLYPNANILEPII